MTVYVRVCESEAERQAKRSSSEASAVSWVILTAEPTPGEHPNGPQERLVGVADAVVEGESRTQQRGGQTDNQAQDNHQMQRFRGRVAQGP